MKESSDSCRSRALGPCQALTLLLLVAALAGCATSRAVSFDPGVTETVAGFDPSRLDRFEVYYQDNYSYEPSPSAVLLDVSDDVAFQGAGWSRAQDGSESRLVAKALDAGLEVSELRDGHGNLLGYLVATTRKQRKRQNLYRLAMVNAGSYDLRTHQFQYDRGGR